MSLTKLNYGDAFTELRFSGPEFLSATIYTAHGGMTTSVKGWLDRIGQAYTRENYSDERGYASFRLTNPPEELLTVLKTKSTRTLAD